MSEEINEVQETEPDVPLEIDRVGVKGVKKKITTNTPEGRFFYDVDLDAYVDLPKDKRGKHMSRDIEAFMESIEEAKKEDSSSLEQVLEDICNRLMKKHEYATKAELIASTRHHYEEDFIGKKTTESAEAEISVSRRRETDGEKSVKVMVPGMNVCPCAQETFSEEEEICQESTPSHTQRVELSIKVKTTDRLVRLDWLVKAARNAFSAPVSSLLKREDEYKLVKEAYKKPRFIEDIIRFAINNVYSKLKEENFSKNTEIEVKAESLESIHPHNAFACRKTTLKNLEKNEKNLKD